MRHLYIVIVCDGVEKSSGELQVGDCIIEVNGELVQDQSLAEVVRTVSLFGDTLIGAMVQQWNVIVVCDSVEKSSGELQVGDRIIEVNGEPVQDQSLAEV